MLNGLAKLIFGTSARNGQETAADSDKSVFPNDVVGNDDEWILINAKDGKEVPSSEVSSRFSPVFVADPENGVMETSTFQNLLGENLGHESEEEAGERSQQQIVRLGGGGRAAVSNLVHGEFSSKSQQTAKNRHLTNTTQGKMKRSNLIHDVQANKKGKQRKSRVKNAAGRNNDRKCQYY